jgi:hypothetical protein
MVVVLVVELGTEYSSAQRNEGSPFPVHHTMTTTATNDALPLFFSSASFFLSPPSRVKECTMSVSRCSSLVGGAAARWICRSPPVRGSGGGVGFLLTRSAAPTLK